MRNDSLWLIGVCLLVASGCSQSPEISTSDTYTPDTYSPATPPAPVDTGWEGAHGTLSTQPPIEWYLSRAAYSDRTTLSFVNRGSTRMTFDFIWSHEPINDVPNSPAGHNQAGTCTLAEGAQQTVADTGQSDGSTVYIRVWNVRSGFVDE